MRFKPKSVISSVPTASPHTTVLSTTTSCNRLTAVPAWELRTPTHDLRWTTHINSITRKASSTLGFLCKTLVVTFVYYEFGTLSCVTKLTKVPHFCTNYCRDWNCSPVISPGDIWTLIGWHLSIWGCKPLIKVAMGTMAFFMKSVVWLCWYVHYC